MTWWKTKERKNQVNQGKVCKFPGCTSTAKSKGFCLNHYHLNRHREKKNEQRNKAK